MLDRYSGRGNIVSVCFNDVTTLSYYYNDRNDIIELQTIDCESGNIRKPADSSYISLLLLLQ